MCGIFVLFNPDSSQINLDLANKSLSLLEHRGPDNISSLFLRDGTLFFGHTLLRIRSKIENSLQPLFSKDNNYLITYNGEIYNSDFLQKKFFGNKFCDDSDTRVLIELISKYGIKKTLEELDGMFSFVYLDKKEDSITIVRDHFGIKPLYKYFSKVTNTICFSSEIKPIWNYFKNEMRLNINSISEFLKYKFLANNYTLWQDIKLVAPGSYEKINLNNHFKNLSVNWFHFDKSNINDFNIESEIKNSCMAQLVSEVPVGLQLSGGIDSTLIYEFLKDNKYIETYSVVFPDYEFDEKLFINNVLNKNSKHKKERINFIDFEVDNFDKDLREAIYFFEAPLNHPHTIAIRNLALKASENVKVLLSGEGADEMFGGYHWHKKYQIEEKIIEATQFISNSELCIFKDSPYFELSECDKERKKLFSKCLGQNRILEFESKTHMQELLLRQDKMMMSASIESRVPFLSKTLVQKIFSTSDIERYSQIETKSDLKKILISMGYEVDFVMRKKIGFRLPYNEWILSNLKLKLKQIKHNEIANKIFGEQCIKMINSLSKIDNQFPLLCKYIWVIEGLTNFVETFDLSI